MASEVVFLFLFFLRPSCMSTIWLHRPVGLPRRIAIRRDGGQSPEWEGPIADDEDQLSESQQVHPLMHGS